MPEENELDLNYLLALRDLGYRIYTYNLPECPESWYFMDSFGRRSVLFVSFEVMMKVLKELDV